MPGLVIRTQHKLSGGEDVRRLVRLLNAMSADEMANHVEFLSAWGE